jgi:hypothetical protein
MKTIHRRLSVETKKLLLILCFALLSSMGFAQEYTPCPCNHNFSVFSSLRCKDCKNKYFVSTNSGLLNTPVGIRVGLLGRKGAYIGGRFGKGTIYHWDSNTSSKTNLFSVTTGLIFPLYIHNDFSIHTFLGAGYGQWFNKRRDTWTKSGVELEAGLMISYKKLMANVGASVLDGDRTYPKGDGTIGLGYRF